MGTTSSKAARSTAEPKPTCPKRTVTDFNSEGLSVFSSHLPSEITPFGMPGMQVFDIYSAATQPTQMNDGADFKAMETLVPGEPFPRSRTMMRFVDFLPGTSAPLMHRTVTLDMGVIVSGEIELVLDSGETKLLRVGDSFVQRGTMHAWRNPSHTTTCRVFFVQAPSEPMVVKGEVLGEKFVTSEEES
ncbi:hypothetical protein F5Y15DRAFT_305029 [Xylariaceae sp. FL0016]|nr:hypothetical protein F5Y15DRAFT_305029 [Xylariaceae sp. FL0016]